MAEICIQERIARTFPFQGVDTHELQHGKMLHYSILGTFDTPVKLGS